MIYEVTALGASGTPRASRRAHVDEAGGRAFNTEFAGVIGETGKLDATPPHHEARTSAQVAVGCSCMLALGRRRTSPPPWAPQQRHERDDGAQYHAGDTDPNRCFSSEETGDSNKDR